MAPLCNQVEGNLLIVDSARTTWLACWANCQPRQNLAVSRSHDVGCLSWMLRTLEDQLFRGVVRGSCKLLRTRYIYDFKRASQALLPNPQPPDAAMIIRSLTLGAATPVALHSICEQCLTTIPRQQSRSIQRAFTTGRVLRTVLAKGQQAQRLRTGYFLNNSFLPRACSCLERAVIDIHIIYGIAASSSSEK